MGPHNFEDSKAWSEEMAKSPWLEPFYRRFFPAFHSMFILPSTNQWAQRGGIDRVIQLTSSKVVHVEEKFRSQAWGDFFMEIWSDKHRGTPGWADVDLACDYFSYIFVPTRDVHCMPYLNLRGAWLRNKEYWMQRYLIKEVPNQDGARKWITVGCCVPIAVVRKAVADENNFRQRGPGADEQAKLF